MNTHRIFYSPIAVATEFLNHCHVYTMCLLYKEEVILPEQICAWMCTAPFLGERSNADGIKDDANDLEGPVCWSPEHFSQSERHND